MFLKWLPPIGLIALAHVAALSAVSASGLNIDKKYGAAEGWTIGYSETASGCVASATFSDQTTVWLGVTDRDKKYYFALTNPNWQSIESGKQYDLRLSAVGSGRWQGKFFGLMRDGEKGVYAIGLKDGFLHDIVRTSGIEVTMGNRTVARLSLQGSPAAMSAIFACEREASNGSSGGRRKGNSSGTGFFVTGEGHILTNNHVIAGCTNVLVQKPGGNTYKARVLASDSQNDLGLIVSDMKAPAVASLRQEIKLGENVSVFGFPLTDLLASTGNFTVGYVSALSGLRDNSSQIQISAPVQPGNSGGPVVDKNGNVVAVVVSVLDAVKMVEAAGLVPQNVNFAIKGHTAVGFMDANNVKTVGTLKTAPLDSAEVAEQARSFTVRILCES